MRHWIAPSIAFFIVLFIAVQGIAAGGALVFRMLLQDIQECNVINETFIKLDDSTASQILNNDGTVHLYLHPGGISENN